MKGVPLRIEIGPKDIKAGTCEAARRGRRIHDILKRLPG